MLFYIFLIIFITKSPDSFIFTLKFIIPISIDLPGSCVLSNTVKLPPSDIPAVMSTFWAYSGCETTRAFFLSVILHLLRINTLPYHKPKKQKCYLELAFFSSPEVKLRLLFPPSIPLLRETPPNNSPLKKT